MFLEQMLEKYRYVNESSNIAECEKVVNSYLYITFGHMLKFLYTNPELRSRTWCSSIRDSSRRITSTFKKYNKSPYSVDNRIDYNKIYKRALIEVFLEDGNKGAPRSIDMIDPKYRDCFTLEYIFDEQNLKNFIMDICDSDGKYGKGVVDYIENIW